MTNPENYKYTKSHEWIKIEGDLAIIGITDHAQKLLTDIVFVELPEIGKILEANDQLAVVESVKSVSDIYAPVGGEIVEVNAELESKPELINQSPFVDGWIVKLKLTNHSDLETLLTSKQYTDQITSKV